MPCPLVLPIFPFILSGDLYVNANASLTITPGTVVKTVFHLSLRATQGFLDAVANLSAWRSRYLTTPR